SNTAAKPSAPPLSANFALPPKSAVQTRLENEVTALKDQLAKLQTDNSRLEAKLNEALASQTNQARSENEIRSLKDQLRQLQADKSLLEAKLKEALAAQPAQVDPRELARAHDKIRSLEKQNALLNVSLAQGKSKAATPAPANPFDPTQQAALADADRKLIVQTEKIGALEMEKKALQSKLDTLVPSAWNANALEITKAALEDAYRQIAEQQVLASNLVAQLEFLSRGKVALGNRANPLPPAPVVTPANPPPR
ncbi:MAG: hypothetical protein DME25_04770, partial [Verrucomicrobia bacterium]